MLCPKCKKDMLNSRGNMLTCPSTSCILFLTAFTVNQIKYIKSLLNGLADCLELAELRGDTEQIEKLENILK